VRNGWRPNGREVPLSTARERVALAGLLLLIFAVRAIEVDQPIVENYVGRQVPTAMVARNLERGSGFLRPCLDTAPFPNLFLVEPPIYAAVVAATDRLTGLGLEATGRLVSALALVLCGWGLYGLARRREGPGIALTAVAMLSVLPVTIRYGRAFQPDALMLGFLVAGLRCWDEYASGRGKPWLAAGAALLATGLAVKVVAAYILVPLTAAIARPRHRARAALAVCLLLPACAWYVHAALVLSEGSGSRASADNGAIWVRTLVPAALLRPETAGYVARFVFRGFTPAALVLAVLGLAGRGVDRLWWAWGVSAAAALALLAGKLHHEYYWLALAPVVAVAAARGLAVVDARSRGLAAAAGVALAALALVQSRSTWRTPAEWAALPEAARAVQSLVPAGAWVAAPEALLFAADRRGCRLEVQPAAARRAAGEWGATLESDGPLALVEFYRARGARFVADVSASDPEPLRLALHEAIRRRYKVLVDRPGVLLADLTDSQEAPDGTH
jgi:hypothetical protein